MKIRATEVFADTWSAVHATEKDGSRKYRYIIHEGSSRSSKTWSIIQAYYLYAMENEGKRMSVWRDTKKDCRDTVMYDMSRCYPVMPNYSFVDYSEPKGLYRFASGSRIEVAGTDDSEKIMGYQGDVIWLNEPYKISKDTFDQLDMRCADFALIDWNPKKAHWIDDLKKDPRAIVIHSTFRKNPFCPAEQKKKILGYQPVETASVVTGKKLTAAEAREYDLKSNPKNLSDREIMELARCRLNEEKKSADKYNWEVYGLGLKSEKPNRIFRWKKMPLQDFFDIDAETYYGVDWGAVDPFAIGEIKYRDGKLFVRERNYLSENKIRENLTRTELAQISDDEEGLVPWLFNKLQIPQTATLVCDPARRMKIIALRQTGWEYAIAAHKPPGSVVDGIDLLNDLDVYYTEDSENIEYEQENYSRKVDRYGIVMEEPEDKDNHHMDEIRYVATHLQMEGIITGI